MPRIDNPDVDFSLITGFKFRFVVDEKPVVFEASVWTGKEYVISDSRVLSSRRGFSKRTRHDFVIDGVPYQIDLTVASVLTGDWSCTLSKAGVPLKSHHLYYEKANRAILPISLGIGAVFGYVLCVYPEYWRLTIPIFIATLMVLNRFKRKLICETKIGA